jgi:hypothetical protein
MRDGWNSRCVKVNEAVKKNRQIVVPCLIPPQLSQ